MAFYLNICNDGKNKEFLLISEQNLNGKLPEVKAQVYFETPINNLKEGDIYAASYSISKKEVEILLNLAQKRETFGVRSTGLFAEGKIDKKNPFNIFSYPSIQSIETILQSINIKKPNQELYIKKEVQPDEEHVLENRHHIFWTQHLELIGRNKTDFKNWTATELVESKLLNQYNLLELILEKYNSAL